MKVERVLIIATILGCVVGVLPFYGGFLSGLVPEQWLPFISLTGWFLSGLLLLYILSVKKQVRKIAYRYGVEHSSKTPFYTLIRRVLKEITRRNAPLSLNTLSTQIRSPRELSETLERIVKMALELLDGESAELALYDEESGVFHSSFVVGKPFKSSSQASLSAAYLTESQSFSDQVLVQPIAFCGSLLGTLRVALKPGKQLTSGDRVVLELLALQSGLAIINSRYTEQLLKMKKASEENVMAKTGFLANLSHEIRGPLGIMINAVEIILDGLCGQITKDQEETLRMVLTNGEHLLDLVNDVLDYAKVESGKITPVKRTLLINRMLKDVTGAVRKEAESKKHKLICKLSKEELAILCDKRHFRQIMINILTNAIKYTPTGGTIEVWAERVPGQRIKINVKDTGVGIDSSEREKVFMPFERIQDSYSLAQGGSGLGMSLTKKLVEVNDGQIDFSSKKGEGTHFWVVFQSEDPSQHILEEDSSSLNEKYHGKGETVLYLAKDNPERTMVKKYLENLGYKIAAVHNVGQGIPLLNSGAVDLVIVDNASLESANKKKKKGVQKNPVEILREKSSLNMPIVLITTRAFIGDIENYLKAGIDRCLIKPVELKELAKVCRELIDGVYEGGVIEESEIAVLKDSISSSSLKAKLFGVDDVVH